MKVELPDLPEGLVWREDNTPSPHFGDWDIRTKDNGFLRFWVTGKFKYSNQVRVFENRDYESCKLFDAPSQQEGIKMLSTYINNLYSLGLLEAV